MTNQPLAPVNELGLSGTKLAKFFGLSGTLTLGLSGTKTLPGARQNGPFRNRNARARVFNFLFF